MKMYIKFGTLCDNNKNSLIENLLKFTLFIKNINSQMSYRNREK